MSDLTTSSMSATPAERNLGHQRSEEPIQMSKTSDLQSLRVNYRLNGQNYLKWSQMVRTYLKGRGRISHLLQLAPPVDDPTFEVWEEEDSMIMSWLWDSMEPLISDTCMFLPTAKDIWVFIQQTFSKARDAAQIYSVKVKAAATKQGNKTVTEYASQLQNLWQELDHYQVLEMKCKEDAAVLKAFIERDRVYDFLAGLKSEYDQVRIQILGRSTTPTLEETISLIRAEESRRQVMLEPLAADGSAFVSHVDTWKKGLGESSKAKEHAGRENKDKLWCSYCKKPRHTRDTCWKLHGKPPSYEWGNRRQQAHFTADPPKQPIYLAEEQPKGEKKMEVAGLSGEELEKLKGLLATLSKPAGECSFALSGIPAYSSCFNASDTLSLSPWIIDTGATDHMTPTSTFFKSYKPCPGNRKILVANGSLVTVAGIGVIHLTPHVVLQNVLHVPKLSTNLISIKRLTHDLNCIAIFYPSHCVLQDQVMGKRIGLAKEMGGLYHLDVGCDNPPSSFLTTTNDKALRLYHLRLGHPPVSLLKTMFPHMFKNSTALPFYCDVCELAKHTRVSFPISNKRSSNPFHLIHSDIWGPSSIPNVTGARWFVTLIDDCTRVTWLFLLKNKSDVSTIIPTFHSMIQNQFGVGIKSFRTDNARDYFNQTLSSFFQSHGIIHDSSCVHTPQQNGVAERKNGHLLNTVRALLCHSNAPKTYWGEAALTATYLINRLPTTILHHQSPIDTLKAFYPHFRTSSGLIPRVFGCTAFVHVHNHHRDKLDPRAIKCIFLGYSSTQKGYKCYEPRSKRFYTSADVTFHEHIPFFSQTYLQGESTITEDSSDTPHESVESLKFLEHNSSTLSPAKSLQSQPSSPSPMSAPVDEFPRYAQVYSRRRGAPPLEQVQESNPESETESTVGTELSSPVIDTPIGDMDLPIALRKGTRECTTRPRYPLSHYVSLERLSPAHKQFMISLNTILIPTNVSEALKREEWRNAMGEEMRALEKNKTWEIVDKPTRTNIVDCKWIFSVKYKADGSLERYKARLVAKGYTQTYGVDYQETFAPVAKMNTVRILLSLAAHFDWQILQYDVKNAFLHGDLDEEVYMTIPPGFEKETKDKVCKLKKALYGLKQSPRAWFERFTKVMRGCGYKQSQGDHTLFFKHSGTGKVTILLVYVDDIILTGNDEKEKDELRKKLLQEFEMKELGRLKYFLGIEVAYSKEGIFISQQKYVNDLLIETRQSGCKPSLTPVDPNHKLQEAKEEPIVDKGMYQRLVGRLIYLAHTRPDIAYPVSMVSQFMHDPRESHLQAAYRILHYLKGCPGKGILFKRGSNLTLEVYTDADYAGSLMDRRSTTGYCAFLGGNLVTWKSKKQNVVARSSAESEFRAIAQGVCELLWLKIILTDLNIKWKEPMKLYCDNKSAINIAHNPVQHERTKHIEIDRHFIKEKVEEGLVCISYVPSGRQLADVFTKGLNSSSFNSLIFKLGMENIYSSA